jgi:hypothetical protein
MAGQHSGRRAADRSLVPIALRDGWYLAVPSR